MERRGSLISSVKGRSTGDEAPLLATTTPGEEKSGFFSYLNLGDEVGIRLKRRGADKSLDFVKLSLQ